MYSGNKFKFFMYVIFNVCYFSNNVIIDGGNKINI